MTPNEYQKQALRTDLSRGGYDATNFSTKTPDMLRLADGIDLIVKGTARQADSVKRGLFYHGKEKVETTRTRIPIDDDKLSQLRIYHASLGIVSELAELNEAAGCLGVLATQYLSDRATDVKEECGDLLWYVALMLDAFGLTMEDAMAANIRKLKARYPDKFDAERAKNRDLDAEREALKGDG